MLYGWLKNNFTFHDVSINTVPIFSARFFENSFTFHDVSINTSSQTPDPRNILSLHSTMFLLILIPYASSFSVYCPLHSTMFLLILNFVCAGVPSAYFFTFHDVSINTHLRRLNNEIKYGFTFHDVSINTI